MVVQLRLRLQPRSQGRQINPHAYQLWYRFQPTQTSWDLLTVFWRKDNLKRSSAEPLVDMDLFPRVLRYGILFKGVDDGALTLEKAQFSHANQPILPQVTRHQIFCLQSNKIRWRSSENRRVPRCRERGRHALGWQ